MKTPICEFVEEYCKHVSGEQALNEREFQRRYRYTPLKYFHKELGLEDKTKKISKF